MGKAGGFLSAKEVSTLLRKEVLGMIKKWVVLKFIIDGKRGILVKNSDTGEREKGLQFNYFILLCIYLYFTCIVIQVDKTKGYS